MNARTERERMVDRQIRARGIRDPRVLAAMETVPREAFLPPELRELAYDDTPLPIAAGQTISQPYIVARMTQALLSGGLPAKVLEVGFGCGYQTAVLAPFAGRIFAVERVEPRETQFPVVGEPHAFSAHVRDHPLQVGFGVGCLAGPVRR